jgi:hypothetical protein
MSLAKEQTRFLGYGDTYLKGEATVEGFATAVPNLAPTPGGTATKTIQTRRAKHGQSTMSKGALERSKAQSNNPNKSK